MTLFATHYFELTRLATQVPGVVNLHLAAVEYRGGIVFLHEVRDGPASRSYGLQVARLAGLPATLVRRAAATLERLESEAARHNPQRDLFDDAGGASTDPGRSGTFDDMPPEESAPFDDMPFDAAGPAASLAPDPAPDPARLAAAAIARELEDLDPEDLTPRQAHERLRAWHGRLQQS